VVSGQWSVVVAESDAVLLTFFVVTRLATDN